MDELFCFYYPGKVLLFDFVQLLRMIKENFILNK